MNESSRLRIVGLHVWLSLLPRDSSLLHSGRIVHELDTDRDLDIPETLVLVQFNVVERLELQEFKKEARRRATRDSLAQLVVRHVILLFRTVRWSQVFLENVKDFDCVLVPLGGCGRRPIVIFIVPQVDVVQSVRSAERKDGLDRALTVSGRAWDS
jgi:hypothetical protein